MEAHGYRFGMRQPSSRVKLSFKPPKSTDIEFLDQWILEALEFDINKYQPRYVGYTPRGTTFEAYFHRWLCVTNILLQDIKIPAFESASIISLKPNHDRPHHFIADFWMPAVENLPPKIFYTWLEIANELIKKVLESSGDQEALEQIYQDFHQKHVLPWSRRIPGARSTVPILQAAFESGIPFRHLGSGRYVLGWGHASRIFDRSSNILDSAIGSAVTQHKHIALQWMRSAGVPVPAGKVFKSGSSLTLADVADLRRPLVVKPVDRDRGEGVTLGIDTEAQLQTAITTAAKLSSSFLVEEQIAGTCHRILVIDGRVIYAVKRNPKSVIGDGVRSIAALISDLNAQIRKKIPNKRLPEYPLDDLAIDCLKTSGLTPDSVPSAGERAVLRPAQSTRWGGDPQVVTMDLHPDNVKLAIRVARLFGLQCAGVDFITTDASQPWYQNGAVINEVNYAPLMGRTHQFQRDAASSYLKTLFPNQGRIPIHLFVGAQCFQEAEQVWREQIEAGQNYILCSEQGLVNPDGSPLILAGAASIPERIAMLRADTSIDGLVVHAKSPNFFASTGWPFEYVSTHFSSQNKTG